MLDIFDARMNIDAEYDFFAKIETLTRLTNGERFMYREDYYAIERYVKAHHIPYSLLGNLKRLIKEYDIPDSDFE